MSGENPDLQASQRLDEEAASAARQVVDGQTHDGNPEYPEHHPNAIQDRDEAEYVATATKDGEEKILAKAKEIEDMVDWTKKDTNAARLSWTHAKSELGELAHMRRITDKDISDAEDSYTEIKSIQDSVKGMKSGGRNPINQQSQTPQGSEEPQGRPEFEYPPEPQGPPGSEYHYPEEPQNPGAA